MNAKEAYEKTNEKISIFNKETKNIVNGISDTLIKEINKYIEESAYKRLFTLDFFFSHTDRNGIILETEVLFEELTSEYSFEDIEQIKTNIFLRVKTYFESNGFSYARITDRNHIEQISYENIRITWSDPLPKSKDTDLIDNKDLLELLTQAHMKGQRDAGCNEPSYSNARSDCMGLLKKDNGMEWLAGVPEKYGGYWVRLLSNEERPAVYRKSYGTGKEGWFSGHRNITAIVTGYRKYK